MIKKQEVKTYIERLYCDKCGTEMRCTGGKTIGFSITYYHECLRCGESIILNKKYPQTVYEEAEGSCD